MLMLSQHLNPSFHTIQYLFLFFQFVKSLYYI
nr:MAG TPA: hypothetical protein [Caudoviricetes sp.]